MIDTEETTYPTAYTSVPRDAVDDAIYRMRGSGFTFRDQPPGQPLFHAEAGMPSLPEDPTLLDEEEVMKLFFAFTEWTSYAESALWVAQCDEDELEAKAARVRAAASQAAEGRTVTEQKRAAAAHPNVVAAEDLLFRQTCVRKGLETIYHRLERSAAAMSRELSRRGHRATTDRRASKWGA